ncbi:nucleotide disphospho-sugar-binding domain-containing protein [Streptomyces sp. ICBB 8177]|uniref:nucleotide disphospho-sugar-binding domain-containing protein n=1 Tax=Streptomyces sp. ICBB 8177 TaxID=563922 RepID=UPI0013053E4A|nr:nucleotide disphospho-sugar-binding domain-containing protein [Streptomyces sp. ICBB 8177]
MRVLLVVAPVRTHLLPIVPLAWALQAAGHQVLLCGEPSTVETARGAGLHTAEVAVRPGPAGPPKPSGKPANGASPSNGSPGWQPDWDALAARWQARVGRVLDGYLALAREWRPDLIISDPVEFSGPIVAGALGIPAVVHRWGPDVLTTQAREPARRALKSLAQQAGSDEGLPDPALLLDPCPPSMRPEGAAPGEPVRFVPYNGPGGYPDWRPSGDGERVVCVSYSPRTVDELGVGGLAALAEAFGRMDGVRALFTLSEAHAELLGPVPGNVEVVAPAPLSLLLDRCAAVVHHGGSGTGLTALAMGLPQLVLPQALPALDVYAERVTASGSGFAVDHGDQDDPARLRTALDTLLGDPRYAKDALRCADEVRAMPLPSQLVPRLEEVAGARS